MEEMQMILFILTMSLRPFQPQISCIWKCHLTQSSSLLSFVNNTKKNDKKITSSTIENNNYNYYYSLVDRRSIELRKRTKKKLSNCLKMKFVSIFVDDLWRLEFVFNFSCCYEQSYAVIVSECCCFRFRLFSYYFQVS